jgi:7-cyano-7-deazaguanine synthase
MDSAVCLAWAKAKFTKVYAITIDYGQRHTRELAAARVVAASFGIVPKDHFFSTVTGAVGASTLTTNSSTATGVHPVNHNLPSSFTPGRNAVFLSTAAGIAYQCEARHIVIGACQTDNAGYPDCRGRFLDSMQESLSVALDTPIVIHAPLLTKTKAEIWGMAKSFGLVNIVERLTHTCYHNASPGCGECPACLLRNQGKAEAVRLGLL